MNKRQIFDIIVGHAREVIPDLEGHDFQWDDSLRELGANSIDRSEIVILTLESCSLDIPLVEIARAGNVGELAEMLYERVVS